MCCTGCTGGKGVCVALVTLEVRGMCCTGSTGGKGICVALVTLEVRGMCCTGSTGGKGVCVALDVGKGVCVALAVLEELASVQLYKMFSKAPWKSYVLKLHKLKMPERILTELTPTNRRNTLKVGYKKLNVLTSPTKRI